MKRKNWFLRLAAAAALCGVLVTTALAAEAGSAQDPLVTLSYLNETFMNTIMARVDEKIAARGGQGGHRRLRGALRAGTDRRDHRRDTEQRRRPGSEPPVHDDHREPGRSGYRRHHQAAGAGGIYRRLSERRWQYSTYCRQRAGPPGERFEACRRGVRLAKARGLTGRFSAGTRVFAACRGFLHNRLRLCIDWHRRGILTSWPMKGRAEISSGGEVFP